MPKFIINANEEVFYSQEVEADSLDDLRDKIAKGSVDFSSFQVSDSGQFNIDSIEEIKNA